MDTDTAESLRKAARANGVTDWKTLEAYIRSNDEDAARGLIWDAAENFADEEADGNRG